MTAPRPDPNAVFLAVLIIIVLVVLAMDTHDRSDGRPVMFVLDDTRIEVTPAEEAALKREIGW